MTKYSRQGLMSNPPHLNRCSQFLQGTDKLLMKRRQKVQNKIMGGKQKVKQLLVHGSFSFISAAFNAPLYSA